MSTITELREQGLLLYRRTKPPAPFQLQSPPAPLSSDPDAEARVPQSAHAVVTHRNQIPGIYLDLEPRPLSAFDDNPIFNENGAARFLGISAECVKKWRQRNQGPDYLQYGRGGPVRYELHALMAFRAANEVKVGARP